MIGSTCSEDDCEECAGMDYMDKCSDFGEELHYSSYLFDELSFCRATGQILIPCHMEFMAQLLSRADQDIGDWADRHARTTAEAQDEVLTCLGMVIWEKMQTIWNRDRCEKRAQELLIYVGMSCIRRSFNIAVENLHGEEMIEQLLAEEALEAQKKAKKKKKKKKSKKTKATPPDEMDDETMDTGVNQGLDRQAIDEDIDDIPLRKNGILDEDAEFQLLSSMGWCNCEDTPERDSLPEIPEDDLLYWQQNQSQLVSRRMEQRQRLQDRFNDLLLRR